MTLNVNSPVKRLAKRLERPIVILCASVGLSGLLLNLDFNLLEANLYDLRVSRSLPSKPDSNIVLVTLDDKTTQGLDEFAPLSLELHTQFIEALEKLQPRAVGYLVDLNQVSQVNSEHFARKWGPRFVESVHRMEAAGRPVVLGTFYDNITGEVVPPYPLSSLAHSIAIIHKDGNVFAHDKVTRRALIRLHEKPAFHVVLAQKLGLVPQDSSYEPRGAFNVPEAKAKYFFFRYHGNTVMRQDKPFDLPYRRVSFIDVMRGEVDPSILKDKIVLVGTLQQEDSADFAFTPFSKVPYANPKMVIHANILDSIIHNDGVVLSPSWANWLSTLAVTAFVIGWVLNSTPLYGVFATLGLTTLFFVLAQVLFQSNGLWIRASQPLVGIFLGYYLVVPYRLIREYKKRWDYQRKNELLTQVEELKRNFLSLVTHDLKTPVARIQGLAEVLLRKASDYLQPKDKETVQHIIRSTEELNRFISSILELSKYESSQVSLNLESKDVNQIIERLTETFQIQSRAKGIQIITELEPLFPIRVDANLITKVMSNLIDNAIKYSPPGSQIKIDSKELDKWVVIQVSDQGIGMTAEERENLFTRFYRVKNEATAQISGTGLGLYLTKYFIEAHQGHVEVESEPGKGSTFKIYLPIEDDSVVVTAPSPLKRKKFWPASWAPNVDAEKVVKENENV